ncbi:MAG: hypothetical protein ACI4BI_05000, partial [Anaerotardibacter sp.]
MMLQKTKGINAIPIVFSLAVVVFLVFGVFFVQNYLMQETLKERSSQLRENVVQIKANLEQGLSMYWYETDAITGFVEEELVVKDKEDIVAEIKSLEERFNTHSFGARIVLLDSQGYLYTNTKEVGVWNDVIKLVDGAERNTFVTNSNSIDGTYLAFAEKLDKQIVIDDSGKTISHVVLLKDISTLKDFYSTEAFEGMAATYIIRTDGIIAYNDSEDILDVRNMYKTLESAEYIQGRSFNDVMLQLQNEGVAVAKGMLTFFRTKSPMLQGRG